MVTNSKEVELAFEWAGLGLVGSLHLPSGAGPFPAVVMAQGSGPADRDSGGYFNPIRARLVERGIATYSFDKPGCGESEGDWRYFGLEARSAQVVSALELIRGVDGIDGDRVGLWGHSQGGWLVQKLAGRGLSIAFAVASSAPTLAARDQIVYDCDQELRTHGYSDEQVESAVRLTHALLDAAASGTAYETIRPTFLEPAESEPWYDNYPTVADAEDWQHMIELLSEPHEPLDDLQLVDCPFLALYGGQDPLLPPWRGAEESGRALAESASSDVTVVVFPNGDHRLQEHGGPAFVPGYLDFLTDWIARRVV